MRFLTPGTDPTVSRTSVAPLDRIQCLMNTQTHREFHFVRDFADAAKAIWKAEGLGGFWRGNTGTHVVPVFIVAVLFTSLHLALSLQVTLLRIAPSMSITFGVFEDAKRSLSQFHSVQPKDLTPLYRFAAGATAGLASMVVTYPAEVVQAFSTSLILSTVKTMYKEGGVRKFYKGLGPSVVGIVPYAGLNLTIYETLKQNYLSSPSNPPSTSNHAPSPLLHLFLGIISTATAASAVYPISAVRQRLQAQGTVSHPRTYNGWKDVVAVTLKGEGIVGFYRGLPASLAKAVPSASISYAVYEWAKEVLGVKGQYVYFGQIETIVQQSLSIHFVMRLSVSTYCKSVNEALSREDGVKVAALLSHRDNHALHLFDDLNRAVPSSLSHLLSRALPDPWNEIVLAHANVILALQGGGGGGAIRMRNVPEAVKQQSNVVLYFSRAFVQCTKWALPIMYTMSRELVDLAARADADLIRDDKDPKYLEEAYRTLTKMFSLCANDRSSLDRSRKWGTYYIVNLLFKICYRLGKQNLAITFAKVLKSGDLPPLERFPASHRIEFYYYSGMLTFLDEQFDTAEDRLGSAASHCLRRAKRNKRYLILTYLIPVRILRGTVPSPALFRRYPSLRNLYADLVDAVRKGDVRTFDRVMEEKEEQLVRWQVYQVVEKIKVLCLRNLLKKVYKISGKSVRLSISPVQSALAWLGCNSSAREVECIVANLIERGFVRGYISHDKQVIVLSNQNPFPSIKSVTSV
ncbi:COP9 signalosome (CSN) subunit [Gonapodya sp. JEL0774]|nr:COP9 signalosome (CSN) subunit [Gonapodya sp. JEL0774]